MLPLRCLPFALIVSLALAACTSPSMPPPTPGATPSAGGSLTGLVKESATSKEDAELRELLTRSPNVRFPVRVGVVFFDYDNPLKPEDQQAVLDGLGKELVGSGLALGFSQIPQALISKEDSIDTIRTVAARFQSDLVLLISGRNVIQKADAQPLTFFDNFSSRSYYDSRTTLSGLGLAVFSGTFLTPFEVAGKAGPALLDPTGPTFQGDAYQLRLKAHTAALNSLKTEFMASLQRLKAVQAAAPAEGAATAPASPTP